MEQSKKCPNCGNFFKCETESDCWCHSINITQTNMKRIAHQYTDCLCPKCLNEFADN